MGTLNWPDTDELGNIIGIKVPDYYIIRPEDKTDIVVHKQEKQIHIYERWLRNGCKT